MNESVNMSDVQMFNSSYYVHWLVLRASSSPSVLWLFYKFLRCFHAAANDFADFDAVTVFIWISVLL